MKATPIYGATRMEVFVDNSTRLGRRLDLKYGSAPVSWCGGATAKWCSNKLARSIDDPAVVTAASRFANQRLDGWGTPSAGAPVPDVSVRFYDGRDQIVGTFASGSNFFARGGAGMLSRPAVRKERATYLSLVGLTQNDVTTD